MDIRKVKKLIGLLEESDIAEIEIHEGEESVRISRISSSAPAMVIPAAAQVPAPAAPPAATESSSTPTEEAEPEGHIIRCLLYTSPSPRDSL